MPEHDTPNILSQPSNTGDTYCHRRAIAQNDTLGSRQAKRIDANRIADVFSFIRQTDGAMAVGKCRSGNDLWT
jgi:hypothetical protein